jgi:hypothetical protein
LTNAAAAAAAGTCPASVDTIPLLLLLLHGPCCLPCSVICTITCICRCHPPAPAPAAAGEWQYLLGLQPDSGTWNTLVYADVLNDTLWKVYDTISKVNVDLTQYTKFEGAGKGGLAWHLRAGHEPCSCLCENQVERTPSINWPTVGCMGSLGDPKMAMAAFTAESGLHMQHTACHLGLDFMLHMDLCA